METMEGAGADGLVEAAYQRFRVKPSNTHMVTVTVVRGRNVRRSKQTKDQAASSSTFPAAGAILKTTDDMVYIHGLNGVNYPDLIDKAGNWLKDVSDVPDCYLTLKIPHTPNGLMRTKTASNQRDPEWDEKLNFYFNADVSNFMQIKLYDANILKDEILGAQVYQLDSLPMDEDVSVTLTFPEQEKVELDIVFRRSIDDRAQVMRYSSELCGAEAEFVKNRKQKVFEALRRLLNEDGPKTENEVPIVAMLGSGGGFRAMVGFSGAISAIDDSGIFDCTTYVAGLSGSTWYLSWLYSHPQFPEKKASELQPNLQKKIGESPFQLLGPQSMFNYMNAIKSKRALGQPVSFTDLFGLMVGNTLLKDRLHTKLSDQRSKVAQGEWPLPLYTCIHVKKQVQARVYNEWVEFTPYEVGIPKYGTFMNSEYFGSIFYMGKLLKSLPESPIHYLQGIWGSAFAVLFTQLLWIVKTDATGALTYSQPEINDDKMEEEIDTFVVEAEDEADVDIDNVTPGTLNPAPNEPDVDADAMLTTRGLLGDMKTGVSNFLSDPLKSLASVGILNTVYKRAAAIFNPLRGLDFEPLFDGDIPVTQSEDDETFKGHNEVMSADSHIIYLVDGGLGFNSPYAILLRPQRGVQLYISFDFSARPTDMTPPFKELLLAEKWAGKAGVPFPPISTLVDEFLKEPLRECYVFRDPDDRPDCPIVVHFALINIRFKEFKSPGVRRTTAQERKFADFSLFEGSNNPFSTFNFKYTPESFQQLSGLTAFNALNEVDRIKQILKELVVKNRNATKKRDQTNIPSRGGIVVSLLSMFSGLFAR